MRTKIENFDRNRTKLMMTAEKTIEITYPKVKALVDNASRVSGSKMTAYEIVARKINSSASWVRKFLGRQPVTLEGYHLFNIADAFNKMTAALEQEAYLENQKIQALRAQHDLEFKGLFSLLPPNHENSHLEGKKSDIVAFSIHETSVESQGI